MISSKFFKASLAAAIVILAFPVACGKKDGSASSKISVSADEKRADDTLSDLALGFPEDKAQQGIKFENIPPGVYKLKIIASGTTSVSTDEPDWRAVQVLSVPGSFSASGNTTKMSANWKGTDKGLGKDKYLYSYAEFSLPLQLTSTGSATASEKSIYYLQKIRSDWNQLEWLADTGNVDNREDGTPYLNLFSSGHIENGVYTGDLGFANIKAKGLILPSDKSGELEIYVESNEKADDGSAVIRIVHLTYVK